MLPEGGGNNLNSLVDRVDAGQGVPVRAPDQQVVEQLIDPDDVQEIPQPQN